MMGFLRLVMNAPEADIFPSMCKRMKRNRQDRKLLIADWKMGFNTNSLIRKELRL